MQRCASTATLILFVIEFTRWIQKKEELKRLCTCGAQTWKKLQEIISLSLMHSTAGASRVVQKRCQKEEWNGIRGKGGGVNPVPYDGMGWVKRHGWTGPTPQYPLYFSFARCGLSSQSLIHSFVLSDCSSVPHALSERSLREATLLLQSRVKRMESALSTLKIENSSSGITD